MNASTSRVKGIGYSKGNRKLYVFQLVSEGKGNNKVSKGKCNKVSKGKCNKVSKGNRKGKCEEKR